MAKASKVLVVVITVACLSFLGFAAVTVIGGTNWRAEALKLDQFTFERSGENWVATHKVSGDQVGSSKVLPEVIAAARQRMLQEAQQQQTTLQQNIDRFQQELKTVNELIAANESAFRKREQQLVAELNRLEGQIEQLASEANEMGQEVQATRIEAGKRRDDVFRLQNQLDLLRADRFRAMQQKTNLEDALVRLNGDVERLERRQEQLASATQSGYDN